MTDRDDLIRFIRDSRFRPSRVTAPGYDLGEVDDFLDRLEQAVAAGEPITPLINRARFTRVRLREGYTAAEVDDFLISLRGLEHLMGEEGDGVSAPDGSPARARRAEQPPPTRRARPEAATREAAASTTDPGVIQEQRGLLGRLRGR